MCANATLVLRTFIPLNKLRAPQNPIWFWWLTGDSILWIFRSIHSDTDGTSVSDASIVTICHPAHNFLRCVEKSHLQPLIDILWN